MYLCLHYFRWEHFDPTSRAFDPAPARAIAERIVRPLIDARPWKDPLEADPRQTQCEHDLDLALVAHYGPWVAGWNWARTEHDGGGPVSAWCCARDSILPKDEGADATFERVARAVSEWCGFLRKVSRLQAAIRKKVPALPIEDAIERAAVRYVPFVLEHTGAGERWYETFQIVFGWHLHALGFDDDARIRDTIRAIVNDRFQSFVEPSDAVVADVSIRLGLSGPELQAPRPMLPDALSRWLSHRARAQERRRYCRNGPVAFDGHRAFIDARDRARSLERSQRMHDALTRIREAAGEPLTWALLRDAQRRVLSDDDVDFRRGDAFAKGGRERYGLSATTRADFERHLAAANDRSIGPLARAARVYLDVCFFHPFPDGNARAARLALDHVLTSEGLALHLAEPLFQFPYYADDLFVIGRIEHLLDHIVGPRGDGASM